MSVRVFARTVPATLYTKASPLLFDFSETEVSTVDLVCSVEMGKVKSFGGSPSELSIWL